MKVGELWFVAKDVAQSLDYTWNGSAAIAHVPEEWKVVRSVLTTFGEKETWLLSEQGLYFFLARSDKEKALPFQKWLAGDVLPSIRQTGGYGLSEARRTLLDLVPEATKQLVIKSFTDVAMHNPEKARTLNSDILNMLIALSPAEAPALPVSPEPAIVSAFWQAWAELIEQGFLPNHSASSALVAVNLPEFIRVAREQGFYSFDRRELCRLLPESRKHALLNRNKTIHSVAAHRSVKCWVFRRAAD